MSEKEFLALIAWYRASSNMDWSEIDHESVNALIDRECSARGYKSWTHVPDSQ